MAARNLIASVPFDGEPDFFGHWLSGFTDGEGCFSLRIEKAKTGQLVPRATFKISLRRDDEPVLVRIRDYWGCGRFHNVPVARNGKTKPQLALVVSDIERLAHVVVPHFDRFPLQAKKRVDFQWFRRAVAMLMLVKSRPFVSRGGRQGFFSKWSTDEIATYANLVESIKNSRAYASPFSDSMELFGLA